jgi:hypothetical protein
MVLCAVRSAQGQPALIESCFDHSKGLPDSGWSGAFVARGKFIRKDAQRFAVRKAIP